ncbi:type II toxin-antitoxin system VapC family toxin [Candidatus Poriferisodalis sp.]|uniref:type II toxin-antitoxin system VapC family toxin n=1 Tax=Candidatus Poriferisodalis sp. TaxID=3101277 RepID=UPI003C6F118D
MKLVDANVLLYAVNEDADRHRESRRWLDWALNGGATVAFAWLALLAFVRVSTHRGVFSQPLTPAEAIAQAREWIAQPAGVVVEPTARHLGIVSELLASSGSGGNLVNDAHLAALAIEHRCEIVSFDRGFNRFEGIRLEAPS